MFRKAALIGFILGIMPAFMGSASALTLQDALSKARENLPSYQAVKKKVEAADASYQATLGPYLPSIDASAQADRDYRSSDDYSTKGYGATLSYGLFNPRRRPVRDIAGFNLETQKEELRKNLLELDYRVKVIFYTALADKNILDQRRIQLKNAQTDYDIAEGRRKLGVARLSEVLQASVRLEQARFNVVQAEGELNKTVSELSSLIGKAELDVHNAYENNILNDLPEGTLSFDSALPEFNPLADATLQRPEIRQAEIALKTAQSNLSLSGADFYPTLSANLSYSRGDAGTLGTRMVEDKNIGLTASWNIFELGKFYRKKAAGIEIAISDENIKELKRQLLLDCRKGWEDLATAMRNNKVAGAQLQQATQNYEQAFGEYKVGVGDILSLVQAESLLAGAREQLIAAQLNVALATALLEKISGKQL
ncbi:MAG: TolC family protein [Syntrophales bacterium]|jgi:outer membrane protein TolC|nr:TolC family protein [Syntrophales bacterium]